MRIIKYRKLKKYKYQLMDEYHHNTLVKIHKKIMNDFIMLYEHGELVILKGYAWDGPSGPTIDTKTFMRGSLVHDALYQLMRCGELDYGYRKYADWLAREIFIEDGMLKFRAWYVWVAVRLFAGRYAKNEISDNK